MRIALLVITVALLSAGCASSKDQLSKEMTEDKKRCEGVGFEAGTTAMAQCMASAAQTRSAEQDRASAVIAQ